ncbi:hypothetical protein KC678_05875 [Candidatus Dojkabacteria bacterium]|uniref:Uncharacterized protein n=1 Tax=Candidatus Dojkabacteria bacterium TaxID=2099670 RepID=A0A955L2N3_9BACT|nr:hypothetical protein [Candidatus Dojkabacteria bacterium]MCB1712956.1 hypothetical protein [Candidatus Riesia sp.]
MQCKTCSDERIFKYHGRLVSCADCSDDFIKDLIKQLQTIRGMCGNPDAVDACHLINKRLGKIIDWMESK